MTTTVNTEPLFFGSFILFYDTRVARAVTRHTHTLPAESESEDPRGGETRIQTCVNCAATR